MKELSKIEPGFLLVNKPVDWTSFDVVGKIRGLYKKQDPKNKNAKVGHAGTLDPFATGLLIVGTGREATRQLDDFKKMKKTYLATIYLGATSDTGDVTGEIVKSDIKNNIIKINEITTVLLSFIGKQLQTPPMYSAKKVGGKRLYDLARAGVEIERQPCEIEIYDIKLIGYEWPKLKIEVDCGAGTYIRTLAEDIGKKLDCGAYCEELTRTRIGEYNLEDAVNLT